MNFKELGEYVMIKKTYFQKLQKAHEQYESRKEFSREYMRKKYSEEKLKKTLNKKAEEDLFNFHVEHTS